jgi:hypothetical protein
MQDYCREMEKSKLVTVEMGRGDASTVGKAEARANNSQLERLELEQPE